jgi:hypothetical protein
LCPSGYRNGPPACAQPRPKKQPGGGDHAEEKGRSGGGGEGGRKKLRVAVWHGKQEMPVARARVSRTTESSGFTTQISRAVGTVQNALGVSGR